MNPHGSIMCILRFKHAANLTIAAVFFIYSFEFNQKISNEEEIGECFIKYPLLMKCNYQNSKQKIVISNGRTVAIIKKNIKKFTTIL